MENNIDTYAHRLSIKNNVCYESAHNAINDSLNRLSDHEYKSEDLVRSAYKHARHKFRKQKGGNINYKNKYLKYKQKYLKLKKQ